MKTLSPFKVTSHVLVVQVVMLTAFTAMDTAFALAVDITHHLTDLIKHHHQKVWDLLNTEETLLQLNQGESPRKLAENSMSGSKLLAELYASRTPLHPTRSSRTRRGRRRRNTIGKVKTLIRDCLDRIFSVVEKRW